jgi:hypothetical protein
MSGNQCLFIALLIPLLMIEYGQASPIKIELLVV